MVILLVIFGGVVMEIKVNSIKLMQEYCVYRGETYRIVSRYCITGKAIGYVDLISRGYAIEGDKNHNYLFVLGDLYKKDGYVPNREKITGILMGEYDKAYCDKPDMLQIMEEFDEYLTDAYLYGDVEMITAHVYESTYCPIALCYDGICASDQLYGYLFYVDRTIYFVRAEDWRGCRGVPSNIKLLDPKVYHLFEPYFSK